MSREGNILLLYTGGTIGMIRDDEEGAYHPFSMENLLASIPELDKLSCTLVADSMDEPIDSSNFTPEHWVRIAKRIERSYRDYDAFIILHGSDTMAYTSSALSFMLQKLSKPVILTGSQLPIGIARSDARENLLTSLELALAKNESGGALINEVAVYFEYDLYRGNRLQKVSSQDFEAFQSPNYPKLAEAGVRIKYHYAALQKASVGAFEIKTDLVPNVGIITCFPGMTKEATLNQINFPGHQAIIIRSFGSGNAPTHTWMLAALEARIKSGVPVISNSQCLAGTIELSKYEAGRKYQEIGVLGSGDMTFEATLTKTMFLLGQGLKGSDFKEAFSQNLAGELSD